MADPDAIGSLLSRLDSEVSSERPSLLLFLLVFFVFFFVFHFGVRERPQQNAIIKMIKRLFFLCYGSG